MDRSLCTAIFVASTLMIVTFSASSTDERVHMGEDYYQNDIDSAVREAERNRRSKQFDYSNRYWYNRTTAKSFELPQLDSEDLEETSLEGAINPTAAGEANIAQPDLPENEQADLVQDEIEVTDQQQKVDQPQQAAQPIAAPIQIGPVLVIDEIEHHFPQGRTVNVQGVYSAGTLTSTPRD